MKKIESKIPREQPALSFLTGAGVLRTALYFVLTCSVMAAYVLVIYTQERSAERRLFESNGKQAVQMQSRVVHRELDRLKSDLLYLATHPDIRQMLDRKREIQNKKCKRESCEIMNALS